MEVNVFYVEVDGVWVILRKLYLGVWVRWVDLRFRWIFLRVSGWGILRLWFYGRFPGFGLWGFEVLVFTGGDMWARVR